MFGLKKKKAEQPENQIPYEVYETLRQPAERRRVFIIRLVAALIVVTLLIFGALALSRKILNTDDTPKNGTTQTNSGNQDRTNGGTAPTPQPESTDQEQTPQPEAGQANPNRNTTTVGKPE